MQDKHTKLTLLRTQLEQERSSFIAHWQDCNDFTKPRRARFFTSDVNRGDRRNKKIIDATATMASRTLSAGLMSGVTSPARQWFRLTTPDPELAEFGRVKTWLHVVGTRMNNVLSRSNIYNVLPQVYGDLGNFATAPMSLEEDFSEVIRCASFPVGSYCLAKDHRGRVNVFTRDFRMTVQQIVQKFGRLKKSGLADWSTFSPQVKNHYDQGNYQTWIDVSHVIQPNEEFDENRPQAKFKRFASTYFERGTCNGNPYNAGKSFLRESGYDLFPILAPRWEVTGEDVYGTDCPAMTALGDIRALQLMHKRKAEAVDKLVRPPMVGDPSLQGSITSVLPGEITWAAEAGGKPLFRPAYQIEPRINELVMDIKDTREMIERAYYVDLFLMLSRSDRRQITAREIDERYEEKLLALGPVLEQLNQDLLDPAIDLVFDIMERQGLIPEPPEELDGIPLKVEYISVMAQAQKTIAIGGIERLAGFAGQIAAFEPSALQKIDTDQMIDEYADAVGTSPRLVRSDEDVAALRQQAAQAQQAQQQAMVIREGAGTVKDLAGADMAGDNALTRLMQAAQAGNPVSGGAA